MYLPSFWKNRELFNFRIGRPFVRDLADSMPWSHAHRHPFDFWSDLPVTA